MFEPPSEQSRRRSPHARRREQGQSLDSGTRQRLQRALGTAIPDVRIHHGAGSDAHARRAGAAAWTYGRDIGFRRGLYRPGTLDGDILLAHELAHAVQQRDATAPESGRGSSAAVESDADAATAQAALSLAGVSDYQRLPDRWRGMNDAERLTFVEQLIPCIRAARQRLEDANPEANDPTGGATHWVSPSGLRRYDPARHAATRYSRTVGTARDRAFPNWARDPATEEARALRDEGAVGPDYAEVTVPGVPETEFLFYRDVR